LRVPGIAQSSLSSGELAAVLNWVLRDLSAPLGARKITPVSAAEVERFRRQPLMDVQIERAKLVSTP
jgi:hypothetical protein